MASSVAELQLIITGDGAGAVRSLSGVQKEMKKTEGAMQRMSSKLEKHQEGFTSMAVAGGAVFAGLTFGISKTITEASKLEESVNAVDVVFGDVSGDILSFGTDAAQTVGLANSEFNQLAVGIGNLLVDAGEPMDSLSGKTIELTKRAADMASVFDKDVGFALSAIEQGMRGETEAIRSFGSDVTDNSLKQYALAKGIEKSVEQMTHQEKTLLRVEKMMEDTAVTAGDFQNTNESLANQQRILSAKFANFSAVLGSQFMPILNDLIKNLSPIIEKLSAWSSENPELMRNIVLATMAVSGLVAVIGILGLALPSIITGFSLLGSIIGVMAGPVGWVVLAVVALAAAGLYLWKNWEMIIEKFPFLNTMWINLKNIMTEVWNVIMSLILPIWDYLVVKAQELWTSLTVLWGVVGEKLLPVLKVLGVILFVSVIAPLLVLGVIIIAAIAILMLFVIGLMTVIDWLVKLYTALVEFALNFQTMWADLWEKIVGLVKVGWTAIKELFISFFNVIKAAFEAWLNQTKSNWNSFWSVLRGIVQTGWSAIKSIYDSFLNSIKSAVSSALNTIGGYWDGMANVATSAINTILGAWDKLKNLLAKGISGTIKIFEKKTSSKRATGGVMTGGGSYLVGENGPELFTPSSNGMISNKQQMANSGSGEVTVNFNNATVRNDGDLQTLVQAVKDSLTQDNNLAQYGVTI